MKGFSVEPGVSRGSSDQKRTDCSSANIPEPGLLAGNASLGALQWPAKSPPLLGAHDPTNTKKVCVLLSSEAQFFSTSGKGEREFIADAGVSLFSLLAMHRAAQSSGCALEFVTFSGSPPPVASFGTLEDLRVFLSKEKEECADLLLQQLQRPQQLRKATAADYCCLLLPHHLGAAIDLYSSSNTGALIKEFGAMNKPVGAVGYGAFALCAKPLTESESFPLAGRLVSTVPLAEEARYPYFGLLPFHLELHFAAEGARTAAGPTGAPGLVVDGQLVSTGSEASTEFLLKTLLLLSSVQQQQNQQQQN
ncbi:hypothetical protein, conserved [Eimeria necatrix]|uniref:Uncharacterized protein n=1 Tax=Eimeria necatrix TaxID=51315 RepID=U6ML83_9EIME|nr:hypothetical protein, conserved [Eimeria necatrix]CDJ62415.1 hypothetical protein, conserved [Eimeria necatrix]